MTTDTPKSTSNIARYFRELCSQARLEPSGSISECNNPNELVQAGFNDIDQRCDRYLAWIDNKRLEAARFQSSVTATNTVFTGIMGLAKPGTKSIAYIGQALGFATSIYDAYNNNLLLGLETSTIKRIVYERRSEFRNQASAIDFGSAPDMVFALRGYLRICTPQSIILDANTYAASVASGLPAPNVSDVVAEQLKAIEISSGARPVTPRTTADIVIDRGKPECPECANLVPKDAGYTVADVKKIQTALCVKADGKAGRDTLAAVDNYRNTQGTSQTGLLLASEVSSLLQFGCKEMDDNKGARNFYEASYINQNSNTLERLVDDLNVLYPNHQLDKNKDASLASEALRKRIVEVRAQFGMSHEQVRRNQNLSRDLMARILSEARKLRNGG